MQALLARTLKYVGQPDIGGRVEFVSRNLDLTSECSVRRHTVAGERYICLLPPAVAQEHSRRILFDLQRGVAFVLQENAQIQVIRRGLNAYQLQQHRALRSQRSGDGWFCLRGSASLQCVCR